MRWTIWGWLHDDDPMPPPWALPPPEEQATVQPEPPKDEPPKYPKVEELPFPFYADDDGYAWGGH